MSRFPVFAFGALVAATVAAFFITQHLKVTTPLIAGFPRPYPPVINPVRGDTCDVTGQQLSHRVMSISFYLLHHSDHVDVRVVDASGHMVATLATNRFMPGGAHPKRIGFTWDGRTAAGSPAPDGLYYVKVHLIQQNRTLTISDNTGPLPVTVKTVAPQPVVTRIFPAVIAASHLTPVKIAYTGNEHRSGTILIYRLAPHQRPHLAKTFLTPWAAQSTTWDGKIGGVPALPGTYRIGLMVTDAACNTGYASPSSADEVVVQP